MHIKTLILCCGIALAPFILNGTVPLEWRREVQKKDLAILQTINTYYAHGNQLPADLLALVQRQQESYLAFAQKINSPVGIREKEFLKILRDREKHDLHLPFTDEDDEPLEPGRQCVNFSGFRRKKIPFSKEASKKHTPVCILKETPCDAPQPAENTEHDHVVEEPVILYSVVTLTPHKKAKQTNNFVKGKYNRPSKTKATLNYE